MLIVNPGFLFFSDVNKPKQEPEKNPTKRPSGKLDLESNEMLIYIPQYKIYYRFEDYFKNVIIPLAVCVCVSCFV